MKSDAFIKTLRKLIQEEVKKVVKEELESLIESTITDESVVKSKSPTIKNSMIESIKPTNKNPSSKPITFTNSNVLNDILNETASGGEWRSVIEANSTMAPNFDMIGGNSMSEGVKVVNNVSQMLASARPSGDVTHVQIDAVPDFSALMSTMKEKGQI